MQQPVIFLDFDGVLNSHEYLQRRDESINIDLAMLDPERVALVDHIAERTGTGVVFSTSWVCWKTSRQLARLLRKRGYTGDIIGATHRDYCPGRLARI